MIYIVTNSSVSQAALSLFLWLFSPYSSPHIPFLLPLSPFNTFEAILSLTNLAIKLVNAATIYWLGTPVAGLPPPCGTATLLLPLHAGRQAKSANVTNQSGIIITYGHLIGLEFIHLTFSSSRPFRPLLFVCVLFAQSICQMSVQIQSP